MTPVQNAEEPADGSDLYQIPLTDAECGTGQGMLRTFQECMRHPLDIFSRTVFDAPMARFFLYGFCIRVCAAILALEIRWMVAGIPMTAVVLTGVVVDVLIELLLLPVFVYLGLRTIGTPGIRFRETFNILALTKTAAILIPIPLIGWQLYTIAILVWSIPALTRGHGVALWRSLMAVLFPVFLIGAALLAVLLLNGMH